MIDFSAFIDSSNLVTMKDGEGGDTLQKTTFLLAASNIGNTPVPVDWNDVKKCEVSPGIWVRHPSPLQGWRSDPRTTSRDQVSSMIMVAGRHGDYDVILNQFKKQIFRLGFYQNTLPIYPDETSKRKLPDFMFPNHTMQYVRSLNMCGKAWNLMKLLWPVAIVTDLFMLLDTLSIVIHGLIDPDFADDDNHIMQLYQARDSMPTPISYLADLIYFKFRPIAGYTDETKTITLKSQNSNLRGPESAVLWKHRASQNAPPLGEFWRDNVFRH